jgi:hypothetical protein
MKARRAHSSGVECIPGMTTGTPPLVSLARRPAAERTPNAGAGGVKAFLAGDLEVVVRVQNYG